MKLIKKVKKEIADNETADKENKYNFLDEVMDKTKPFHIFYSGVEQESYFNILYDMGIRNFLMSFHYIQNRHTSMEKMYGGKGIKFFIDSGAHTYQNDPKYADVTVEEWEKHLQKYLRWAEKNKEYIFAIASFDYENMVGAEVVFEWNKKYFEPFMLRTGIPVCFVWHQTSYVPWEFYCKRYPYVGFSAVNTDGVAIEIDEFKDKLRTAEKNDSLVHGFGMTRTSMLTQLPFYTADSTTWLVGLQYGEVNYWTGTKMTRLKKEKWKGEMLGQIVSLGFDEEKLLAEDTEELIKVNIHAFMEAEKFIHTRLKSMMYWQKARAVHRDMDNLPSDFFPSPEWLTSSPSLDEIKEYAKKFNINPELPNVGEVVSDVVALMNWDNEDYSSFCAQYKENDFELLRGIHDFYINKIRETDEERVEDLQKFFKECLAGNNEFLLQMGTNFDRRQKEREEYLEEDEEYDLVDIPQEEVRAKLSTLLPAPSDEEEEGAPEIDALDEEIFAKADIVPTFDKDGKFLKGQKKVRKPKQVYSKKFPKLACDNCFAAAKCPEYKSGYVCAYNKIFKKFDSRNMQDIIESMQGIVNYNMERMQKAMIFETLNGTLDGSVSSLMDTNIRYMQMLKQMYDNASAETLRQTRVVRADGSMEETTHISNPQSGGILERLFGNSQKEEPKEEPINVTPKED